MNTGVCYRVTTEQGHSCPERKPLYLPEVSAVLSAVLLLPSTVPEPEKSLGTHLVSCHWSHGRLSGDCEGQAEKRLASDEGLDSARGSRTAAIAVQQQQKNGRLLRLREPESLFFRQLVDSDSVKSDAV